MKKVIGVVAEGPTDYMVLKEIIDSITNEENIYYRLQPETNAIGEYGNVWKGVWKWCEDNAKQLEKLFEEITPELDALIIHMDGDVSRKEKEVHCICNATKCDGKGIVHPLQCIKIKHEDCPVLLPCKDHKVSVNEFSAHLEMSIRTWLQVDKKKDNIIITIPCDSTESWIIAAYNDSDEPENIKNPWESIIAKKKTYHAIRISGKKKRLREYENLIPKVVEEWEHVVNKCETAKKFDECIRKLNFFKNNT